MCEDMRDLALRMLTEAVEADHRKLKRSEKAQRHKSFKISGISKKKFVQRYGITKIAFYYLCSMLKVHSDLRSSRRISLERKVLSALYFYVNGNYQKVVAAANCLSQESVGRFLRQVTEALNHPNVVSKYIKFPCTHEARQLLKQNFFNKYGFPGVVGCIDGSHFRIRRPCKDKAHLYYNNKKYHSLNVQIVADHQGRIIYINPKFGGANQDESVWESSAINTFMQSFHKCGESVWLLGDSEYPQRPWLMTPYIDPIPNSSEETYNRVHGRTRAIIENTFGHLRNRWRCLSKDGVLNYTPAQCAKIITACCVLHNIALNFQMPAHLEQTFGNAANQDMNGAMIYEADLSDDDDNDDDLSTIELGYQLQDRIATRIHAAASR